MAANTLACLKEQQHVEFETVTVFATDRHRCFFCGYLGAIKGINSKQQVFDQSVLHAETLETHITGNREASVLDPSAIYMWTTSLESQCILTSLLWVVFSVI